MGDGSGGEAVPGDSHGMMIAALGEQGLADQSAIMEVNTWLHEQPGREAAGHAGGASDRHTRTLTLWWCDPENPVAVALLGEVREQARRRRVTVEVVAVPWNQGMIRHAADVAFGRGGRDLLGFAPTGMEGPTPPANVLIIGGDLPGASPGELATLSRRAQAALDLPIPVAVRHQRPRKGPWG